MLICERLPAIARYSVVKSYRQKRLEEKAPVKRCFFHALGGENDKYFFKSG